MILILGYGNSLRNDDGVGQFVVNEIASRQWPNVRGIARTQLLPELAEDIAAADLVIFVDADVRPALGDLEPDIVRISCLTPPDVPLQTAMHSLTPEGLLALAKLLYGRSPRARLVSIPVKDTELGDTLSPQAQHGAHAAIALIAYEVVQQLSTCGCEFALAASL